MEINSATRLSSVSTAADAQSGAEQVEAHEVEPRPRRPGAPKGDRNGRYRHGVHTHERKAERRWVRRIVDGAHPEHTAAAEVAVVPVTDSAQSNTPKTIRVQVYQGACAGQFKARSPAGWTRKEWEARLRKALGTRSGAFLEASMDRLLHACTPPGLIIPTSATVSAALVLIEALAPENEVQASVAVHIACVDAASGNLLARMARDIGPVSITVRSSAFAKLERAYTSLLGLYHRQKHGNRQVIRIEKVEIQAGSQAIVGQVATG
jgi:hypothetical protein